LQKCKKFDLLIANYTFIPWQNAVYVNSFQAPSKLLTVIQNTRISPSAKNVQVIVNY